MEDNVSYQFAPVRQRREDRQDINQGCVVSVKKVKIENLYTFPESDNLDRVNAEMVNHYEDVQNFVPFLSCHITFGNAYRVKENPLNRSHTVLGLFKPTDRRPIDPPPIIQLKVHDPTLPQAEKSSFLQNPYFFMYASLMAPDTTEELHLLRDGKTRSTTGSVVSSLYHLKDIDNSDAGFFVFPDLSVRMEGTYRLKLSLFEIIERDVYHCKSILSDIFIVYSAKRFPGMEESTFLSRSFADQGLKIRIRKEIRIRRRLAKRKELEPIESADVNRMKRVRGDDRFDNDSRDSSDLEVTDLSQSTDEIRSKRTPDLTERRNDHTNKSPSMSYIRGPYDHMPHMGPYDHNSPLYGPGYPPHRPISWHARPEYDPHYPPYYDPYDRRYGYHPYYYPPPLPEGADHHRYPYSHPPTYGRPPIYPNQPGYYDTPPRIPHSSNESSGVSRPYGYDMSNPYPSPRQWTHYGERPSQRDHSTDSSSSYRSDLPPIPPRRPVYSYPEYYHTYHLPPPPKQDNGQGDHTSGQPGSAKIPIQDLLSTEQQQLQPNSERTTNGVPSPRTYGAPPSAFAHLYPHPSRSHEYQSRHDMYNHSRYSHDVRYPPHESLPHYGQRVTSDSPGPVSTKAIHPPTTLQPQDPTHSSTTSISAIQSMSSRSDFSIHGDRNMEYIQYDPARRSYPDEQSPFGNSGAVTSSDSTSSPQSSVYNGRVVPTSSPIEVK
ncbi:5207_t:CDS:2 [Scutellospora calospora]|uniref:5207_t:CDS:1 n=1 Tax=Scutellospora calospora TaxID=85575 RepID=A0ACA9JWJ2_9GLOM|nr:5207_t:CDS:2 [Scutellospora calospora]